MSSAAGTLRWILWRDVEEEGNGGFRLACFGGDLLGLGVIDSVREPTAAHAATGAACGSVSEDPRLLAETDAGAWTLGDARRNSAGWGVKKRRAGGRNAAPAEPDVTEVAGPCGFTRKRPSVKAAPAEANHKRSDREAEAARTARQRCRVVRWKDQEGGAVA